jgi:hypothetical protein
MMRRRDFLNRTGSQTKSALFVGLVFGLVFLGIGVTVIVFMWTAEGFGAPPLFFRVFATFIALAFIAMGGATAYSAGRVLAGKDDPSLVAGRPERLPYDSQDGSAERGSQVKYTCPACGAPLASGMDVSPHGDVKCTHCGGWFNVHRSS